MAVSTGRRFKRRSQCFIIAAALSALSLIPLRCLADLVFYQPLLRDQHLTTAQWQQILTRATAEGMTGIVLQWGQYGDVAFYNAAGPAQEFLTAIQQLNIPIWLGLYADPLYFQAMQGELKAKQRYFKQQLRASLQLRRHWLAYLHTHPLQLQGWYLPMELNDTDFVDQDYLNWLRQQLKTLALVMDEKLAISLFYNGQLSEQSWVAAAEQLVQSKLQVWVQDGAGVTVMQQQQRQLFLSLLPCQFGLIQEQFRQVSSEQQVFRARPLTDAERQMQRHSCHEQIKFELRYMPAAAGLLPLSDSKNSEAKP